MNARVSSIFATIILTFPLTVAGESYITRTIAEELDSVEVAVIGRLIDGTPTTFAADNETPLTPGSTRFEVADVLKLQEGAWVAQPTIELRRFQDQPAGTPYLIYGVLTGPTSSNLEWMPARHLSEEAASYVVEVAGLDATGADRLRHFIPYLEHADPLIARDALLEFAFAHHHDVVAVVPEIGGDKLAKWVLDDATDPNHLGLYGWMLGVSGATEHAPAVREMLLEEPTGQVRLGIDGVMTGYVMLTGLEGWELIEREKLLNREAAFSETYAAMQSLRYMMKYPPEGVSLERLLESARAILDRPELADLVVSDLAHWQDWSAMDRIIEMYDAPEFQEPSIKRSIVRYLMAAQHYGEAAEGDALPEYAEQAAATLANIKQREPTIVEQAERYFMPPDGATSSPASPAADAHDPTPHHAPWINNLLNNRGWRC